MNVHLNVHFKLTERLRDRIQHDLRRPHRHAAERVGFIACRGGEDSRGLVIIAHDYLSVADDHYLRDRTVGAMMSSSAIRVALQHALTDAVSISVSTSTEGPALPRQIVRIRVNGPILFRTSGMFSLTFLMALSF